MFYDVYGKSINIVPRLYSDKNRTASENSDSNHQSTRRPPSQLVLCCRNPCAIALAVSLHTEECRSNTHTDLDFTYSII